MNRYRYSAAVLALFSAAGQCQDTANPYSYVKMSLTVPWTLYFVFLGAVLIPFVLMVVLAWRHRPEDESTGAGTDSSKS